ncbi:MAG: DNA replication/repair protein RecF [Acidobacteria bacterium]|nr:DNA replication/repair protein RecF [Acidobacteriota bacterium]
MILRELATRNFRNLESARLELDPDANVFVGSNGQGKTNLLEAIYFVSTTKSFRTNRAVNLFRFDADHLFVEGIIESDGIRKSMSVGLEAASARKRELLINGEKTPLDRYVAELPVIAYSAARLEIIRGAPDERRRFLDRGIASLHPGYIASLTKYHRTVEQRNALLRAVADGEEKESSLDAWDVELATTGAVVAAARAEFAAILSAELTRIVREMDYHVDELEVRYEPSGPYLADRETILSSLDANRDREIGAGFTLRGPHRDDLAFRVHGRDASEVLSSGETKMTVLFLKLARVALYRERVGRKPLFIFDDVDAELDLPVIQRLMTFLRRGVQLFATSAKEEVLSRLSIGPHVTIPVVAGRAGTARTEGRP